MNAEEREARERAAATLRNELRTRAERGWERISASETLDVMAGRETGSEVEREAWRLVGETRELAKRGGVTAKWLTDRLAERAGHWERSASAPSGGELTAAERNAQERIAKREPLKLDPEVDAALADIVERIRSVVPATDLTLGGGTVLAARYNHRRSFDVDLWYPVLMAPDIYAEHGTEVWKKHLGNMLESNDGEGRPSPLECAGIARGIEFSITPAVDVRETAGTQPIAGHQVQAQMTQQILEGKILGTALRSRRTCSNPGPVRHRDCVPARTGRSRDGASESRTGRRTAKLPHREAGANARRPAQSRSQTGDGAALPNRDARTGTKTGRVVRVGRPAGGTEGDTVRDRNRSDDRATKVNNEPRARSILALHAR